MKKKKKGTVIAKRIGKGSKGITRQREILEKINEEFDDYSMYSYYTNGHYFQLTN